MTEWVKPDQVFDGHRLRKLAVCIENGRVVGLEDRDAPALGGVVTPGFVDLQVNGGGGVLFNATPTPEGIARIAAAHRRFGTTTILPTVITDAPEVLDCAAEAVLNSDLVPGIHIEGPHIAHAKRGTHAAEHIRPLDQRTLDVIGKLREAGRVVLITLAPEAATLDQIKALAELGAVVSLGHSDARAEVAHAAFGAGARGATHLFNAMSGMKGRDPGVAGAAINATAYVGVIADGVHVADEMIGLALRARPAPDLTYLVSDAMPTVGGPDRFMLYGQEIRVGQGRLVNAEGNLAGAHTTMFAGVRRLVEQVGVSLEQALRMAHSVPLDLIHGAERDRTTLIGAKLDDVLLLEGERVQPLSAKIAPAK